MTDPHMLVIRNKIAQLKASKGSGDYHATELIEHHPEGMGIGPATTQLVGGNVGSSIGAYGLTTGATKLRQGPTDVMIGLSGDSSGLLVPARVRDMLPSPIRSVYNPSHWK